MAGMQQLTMKTTLGQVPGQENPGSKNKAPQVPGQKKPGTYSGPAEVLGWKKKQELFYEGYSTGPHQYGKTRYFFTVGSGDAGQAGGVRDWALRLGAAVHGIPDHVR